MIQHKTIRLVQLRLVRERSLAYNVATSTPNDILCMVRPLFENCYREQVAVIGMNSANFPTVIHIAGIGNVAQSFVSIGNVFKPLLLSNAVNFIICHNHPGTQGQPTPSGADKEITAKLKSIGNELELTMLDHLILSADASQYYSFRSSGLLT